MPTGRRDAASVLAVRVTKKNVGANVSLAASKCDNRPVPSADPLPGEDGGRGAENAAVHEDVVSLHHGVLLAVPREDQRSHV